MTLLPPTAMPTRTAPSQNAVTVTPTATKSATGETVVIVIGAEIPAGTGPGDIATAVRAAFAIRRVKLVEIPPAVRPAATEVGVGAGAVNLADTHAVTETEITTEAAEAAPDLAPRTATTGPGATIAVAVTATADVMTTAAAAETLPESEMVPLLP